MREANAGLGAQPKRGFINVSSRQDNVNDAQVFGNDHRYLRYGSNGFSVSIACHARATRSVSSHVVVSVSAG